MPITYTSRQPENKILFPTFQQVILLPQLKR